MARRVRTSFLALILIALLAFVFAIRTLRSAPLKEARQYEEGDYIPLFANKVYSGNDPCVVYSYFDLPFCPPGDPITHKNRSFKELLAGDCFANTQYELRFKMETTKKFLCEKNLTREEVAKFRDAVANKSVFEMYYDDTQLSEYVGDYHHDGDDLRFYLFNHLDFDARYLGNKVENIKISGEVFSAVDITEDAEINVNFTYSVIWEELELNKAYAFKQTEENGSWLSWVNICVWLGYLCAAIVPYLGNYFSRNSFGTVTEATGVIRPRHIHGDACSCPQYSSLLGAILGVGTQQFNIICVLFFLANKGLLNACYHEAQYASFILINGFTSVASGYMAAFFHSLFTPHGWKECFFQTGALYFVPVFITGLAIQVLAGSHLPKYYKWTDVLYFLFGQLAGHIKILIPSGTSGYNFTPELEITCATIGFRAEIPNRQAWYMKTPAQMFLGGLLPFILIFWWMDDIYASLYHLKVCGAFWTMFAVFIFVITLTVLLGMGCTHYQLSKKDHHWWWRSVFRGGSTAIFMFVYGFYFYARANAQNFMNLLVFLGYNACIFYAIFLILGTIGFYASSIVFCRKALNQRRLPVDHRDELQHRA